MSDNKEYIDVSLYLDEELASKLQKMTKQELLNQLIVLVLKTRVQQETIDDLENQAIAHSFHQLELRQARMAIRALTSIED